MSSVQYFARENASFFAVPSCTRGVVWWTLRRLCSVAWVNVGKYAAWYHVNHCVSNDVTWTVSCRNTSCRSRMPRLYPAFYDLRFRSALLCPVQVSGKNSDGACTRTAGSKWTRHTKRFRLMDPTRIHRKHLGCRHLIFIELSRICGEQSFELGRFQETRLLVDSMAFLRTLCKADRGSIRAPGFPRDASTLFLNTYVLTARRLGHSRAFLSESTRAALAAAEAHALPLFCQGPVRLLPCAV